MMKHHRYTQSKPPVLATEATEEPVDADGSVGSKSEMTSVENTTSEEIAKMEHLKFCDESISTNKAIPVDNKTVEVDTNEILIALLDQFKRINSVLEKQGQAQIQQAATLMQLTDGIKAIKDRLKKPSFM